FYSLTSLYLFTCSSTTTSRFFPYTTLFRSVFTRLLTEGATRGISLSFAEGLARLLIDESVHVQDLVRLPKSAKQKILVVGGAGQMGRWLCRYFRSRGYDVVVNDIRSEEHTS